MKTNVILTLVVLLMNILLHAQTLCPNDVINGDFEAGNTGFTSGLTSNCACSAGTFCVNTNFNLKCPGWPNFGNHTSGGRNFLIVDGNTSAATNVWQTTVPSSPGSTFTFSFWVASVYPTNQQVFDLGMVVNGVTVRQFTISQATPTWTQYTFSGVCPPNLRSIPIAIRQMSAGAFRDFGLDDIYFACCPCKADYTTTLLDNCRNFQFNNISTGAGVTYSWDFGDTASGVNNTSSLANPTHLFSKCGTYEVCLTLKGEGCSSKICYSVDATDNTPPQIACPRNLTVNTNPVQCYYTGTLPQPTVTDNCSKAPEIICSLLTPTSSILITPQTQFPKGVHTISCIARDECGNTSRACTYTLTVKDNQEPVITCPISMTVVGVKDAQGRCKALISGLAPTVSDNCPMVTLTYAVTGATTASGNNNVTEVNFMEGVSTVTYTAVDMDGNRATCSFTVTVRCPCEANFTIAYLNDCGNVQFTNTSTGTAPLTYAWSFGDPNSGTANTSTLQNPSHQFSKCGTYEVCLTITGNGCSSKICKAVVIKDDQAPKIVCPPNVTVSTNPGQCYFSGKFTEPKATDNCDKTPELICSWLAPTSSILISSDTQFPKGEHIISCIAVDDCGNGSEPCTYTLTVVDKELPIITCPPNITVQGTINAEGLCKAVVIGLAPKANDNCPMLGVNWRLSGATIGQGIADASGTNFMQGVTTVSYTALDMAGNSATCSFTVTVECKEVVDTSCGFTVATCYSFNANDPVGVIYDTRFNSNAIPGADWGAAASPVPSIHPPDWTTGKIGNVFGIALDNKDKIFLAATDVYRFDNSILNAASGPGGPSGVYKTDFFPPHTTTPIVSTINLPQIPISGNQLPNTGGVGNGIGNIAYDHLNDQLFLTNLEDGLIYRISTNGTLLSAYDPFQLNDVAVGIERAAERLWGIGVFQNRVYFAREQSGTNPKQIWSIPLDPNGEFLATTSGSSHLYTGAAKLEVDNGPGLQKKYTDIAFCQTGKMLIAERGDPHLAQVFEFKLVNGIWTPSTANFRIGYLNQGKNSAGGVDYGYREQNGDPTAVCNDIVWATANCMDPSGVPGVYCQVYGVEGISSAGNSHPSNSSSDIYIDFDGAYNTSPKYEIGDVEVFKCGGCPEQSAFCDSISVTSMPATGPKDSCCFKLTLNNQKPNFFTAIQLCSSNGVSISDVSVLNGCNLQSFGATQVTVVPAGGVGSTFPAGSKDFIRFCLSNYETVPNQQIIVKYYGPNFEVVCMDTLNYNCTQKPKCIKITNDTVICSENGKYKLKFCVMSDALIPWAASTFVLNPPAGVTFTPSTFTLNTPLQPGQMSCTFTTEISGQGAVDGKEICFSVTAHKQSVPPHLDCCTDTVMRACVILPTCICDKVSATNMSVSSPNGKCCWKINLTNNYSTTYFTGVQLDILTPGVIFGAIDNGFPTWGLTYNPTQAIFKKIPLGTFIGTTSTLPTFCLAGINNSTPIPQIVVVRWLGADGKTVCEDTLKFNCKPPIESDCAVIVKPKIECDTTFIGTYNLSFQVQNNSGHTLNQVMLNSITGGVVNPISFTIPSLANGGTSGILTTQIVGVQPGDLICFLLTVHEKGANGEDLNCCTHSQKYCFVVPDCCKCGTFSNLSFRPAKGAPNMPIKCGDTLGVSCNPAFDPIIAGSFRCVGACAADSVHWELFSLTSILPVASGDVSGPNFSLALLAAYFSTPGTYELTLSSKCGKQSCPPCKLIIKATGCPCCEDFDVFCQSIMNHIEIKLDSTKCKATLTVCNIRACDYLESISWGDGSNSAGPFGPGAMSMHTYAASGSYIISYRHFQKAPVPVKFCFEKRLYDTITIVCKGCVCKGADNLSFGGLQGATTVVATCGSQTPVELPCSTSGALFYFHGHVYCDGDSCLSDQIGWSIGQGNDKIISGTMPISHIFPGGNKGHFDLTNLDPARFSPGVVYTLTIGWNCGGKPCSCTVRFVFKKCPDCACGKFTDIFLRPNSGPSISLSCGDKGPLVPCPVMGQPFNITGSFACQGDDCPKTTLINWTLLNPSGAPVATGSVTTSPTNFSINLSPALFSVKGEYTLKLEGHCGAKLCECLIKFRIETPCPSADCVCGTYSELVIRSGRRPPIPVTCGGTAVLVDCPPSSDDLLFSGQFGCQGEKCPKTTLMDWVLIGPNGSVPIASGTSVISSPNFTIKIPSTLLMQTGVYTLRVIGHCGKLECPCEINFIMDPPCSNDFCECGNFTNMTFRPAKGAPNMLVKCEDTLNLACNPNFDPIISGNFQCVGKNCPIAPMHWELRALPSYTLVAMGDESLTPGFSVTLLAAYFSTPGMYELAFTGDCGNTQSCAPCKLIINAKGCPCCEDYDLFVQSVEQAMTLSVDNVKCKATLNVGNLRKCDVIQRINWGDGSQSTGPFTNGAMEMHFYTGKGPYIVSWLALEYNAAGKVCFEKVFRDTIILECDTSCTCGNHELFVKIGKANLQVHCGDTIDVPGNFGFYGTFECVGNGCPILPGVPVAWTLSGPRGFIEESGQVVAKPDIFIPQLDPANLTIPGLYSLSLKAHCGADSCPCTIYFRVSDYCCRDSSVFLQNAKNVQTHGTLGDCTLSFQATGLMGCMRVYYDWGDGNSTGPITGNNVPITHTYATAGKYVVCYIIEEFKNNLICQRYFHCDTIEVKCKCDCGTFEQVKIVNKKLGTTGTLICDTKILHILPCPSVGKPYVITGKLICNPTDCKGSNLHWELKDSTNMVVVSGNQAGPWFSITLDYSLLSKLKGNYRLVLTGMCGSKTCSCTYGFQFTSCPPTCPCDDPFTASVQAGFNWWWAGNGNCAFAFSPKGILDCDKVSWTISGINNLTNTPLVYTGTTLNNQVFTQIFPNGILGNFLITMVVSHIGPDGKLCERKFTQTVNINCILVGAAPICNDNLIINPGFDQNSIPGILGETGKTSAWVRQAGTPTLVDQAGFADRFSIVLTGKCFGVIDVISNPIVLGPKRLGRVNFAYKASVEDLRPGTHLVLRLSDAPQTGMACTDRCVELARLPINTTDGKWGNISTTFNLNGMEGRKMLSLHVENDLTYEDPDANSKVSIDNLCFVQLESLTTDTRDLLNNRLSVRIFPNPNPGKFTVELPQPATPGMTLRVTDLAGRLVLEKSTETGNLQQTIQAEYLSTGMYFLQVVEKGRIVGVEKFVKQ